MKLKKILLLILIFLFFLILQTEVNGFVLNEGGVGKYYLEELPFDVVSDDVYESAFFYKGSSNEIICVQVPKYQTLGVYSSVYSSILYAFDNSENYKSDFTVYTCSVELSDGLYIGSSWLSSYVSSFTLLDSTVSYTYIGGSAFVYPATSSVVITTLPDGLAWNDTFVISWKDSNICCYSVSAASNCYFYRYGTTGGQQYLFYYGNASEQKNILKYTYDSTNKTWSYTSTSTAGGLANFSIYHYTPIYKNSDGTSISYRSTNQFFGSLFWYDDFPYIMNVQGDLAQGEKDIIIMPRGF